MNIKNLILGISLSFNFLYSTEVLNNLNIQYNQAVGYYNNLQYENAGRIFHKLANQNEDPILQSYSYYYLAYIYLHLKDFIESYNYAILALNRGIQNAENIINIINQKKSIETTNKEITEKRRPIKWATMDEIFKRNRKRRK